MKKLFPLILITLLAFNRGFGQEKLRIFKFDPLPLATSALSFGLEAFNEERTRSTEIHLGIRYKKDNDRYHYDVPVGVLGDRIDQFSDWKGVMASIERRFYVPSFKDKGSNLLNSETSQSGVYFSPSLRFDFNQNEFDYSNYEFIYNPEEPNEEYKYFENSGKINYLSVMPALNFGVQFTIFQYAYIDLHVGGGIRFQSRNALREQNDGSGYSYYRDNNAITTFVIREGVQPTGGVTFGLVL